MSQPPRRPRDLEQRPARSAALPLDVLVELRIRYFCLFLQCLSSGGCRRVPVLREREDTNLIPEMRVRLGPLTNWEQLC